MKSQGKKQKAAPGGDPYSGWIRPHNGAEGYAVEKDEAGKPVGGQRAVIRRCLAYRNVVAVFGRSSGKTTTIPPLFLEEGGRCKSRYSFAYCAPTQRLARKQYRIWKRSLIDMLDGSKELTKGCSDVDLILHVKPWNQNQGAIVEFWGLDEHDFLRGERKHRIVIDECKDVEEAAVTGTLRHMLLGREGKMLFIGTPSRIGKGAAWFKAYFYRGLDDDQPGWTSLNAPSHSNPWLSEQDLKDIEEDCTDDKAYREEVLAEFLEDEGAVFENLAKVFSIPATQVSKNVWTDGEEISESTSYLMYADIGRSPTGDPTILGAFDRATRRQVHLERMQGLPFAEQMQRVDELFQRLHRPRFVFDATGMGYALIDELGRRYGEYAVPVKWNLYTKEADISRARMLCQRAGNEEVMNGPGWYFLDVPFQRGEFECFTMVTESKSGQRLNNPRYEAPAGLHDDSVTAACICSSTLIRDWAPRVEKQQESTFLTGKWLKSTSPARKRRRRKALAYEDPDV